MKWISIKERLPTANESMKRLAVWRVMNHWPRGFLDVAIFWNIDSSWVHCNVKGMGFHEATGVTHWAVVKEPKL